MALIKCSERGQQISSKATTCPHCGCPIERPAPAHAERIAAATQPTSSQTESKKTDRPSASDDAQVVQGLVFVFVIFVVVPIIGWIIKTVMK
jgi:hypothetical protein